MYNYPLTYKFVAVTEISEVQVTDKDKDLILTGKSGKGKEAKKKPSSFYVFRDREKQQPLCQITLKHIEPVDLFEINAPNESLWATVTADKRGHWSIQDAAGEPLGEIIEKNGWKRSCLFSLLFDNSFTQAILYFLFRLRYEVIYRGQKVLELREHDDWSQPVFKLQQKAEMVNINDETLLLAALLVTYWHGE
jgi:hypothetical protein